MRLADTSIRLYRKRDWSVSVRLHSFLMIHAKGGFRLSAYLNQFDLTLTLDEGQKVALDNFQYTDACLHRMDHMIHELWAWGTTQMPVLKDGAGLLDLTYRLFSYPGQGDPDRIQLVVPVLARGVRSQRWEKRSANAA